MGVGFGGFAFWNDSLDRSFCVAFIAPLSYEDFLEPESFGAGDLLGELKNGFEGALLGAEYDFEGLLLGAEYDFEGLGEGL